MAITNPNILSNPIVQADGELTASNQVVRPDDTKVEDGLSNVESIILGWNFNNAVVDGSDPGTGFASLNNADKNLATVLTFNTTSAIGSARFDELVENLITNDRIFLQERSTPANSVLYRVTATPTATGNRVNVPVAVEQNQGSSFSNNSFIATAFFLTARAAGGGSLTAAQLQWIAQTSQQDIDSTSVTNIAPIVADVLIWRRAAIVTNAIINNSGTGLRIDEANRQSDGTFDRESGTAVFDDDLENAYIYVGITQNDFTGTIDPVTTFLEARRNGNLVFSSSLDNLTTPTQVTSGQFTYRRTTNNQYHYIDGDTLAVVTRSTSQTTEYNYNPVGDFTNNVNDLPFSAVDDDFTGRVSGPADNQELTAADRVKLTGLIVSTSTTTGQNLTVSYKDGFPTANVADYDKTWNASNPVLANFGATRTVSILVSNNITVSSVSGGATLGPQLLWVPGRYIYEVTLPAEASTGTPTSHLPVGITHTFLPTGFNTNYKIIRGNVEANLLAAIDAHGTSADITALETKVNNLFPLTPDVNILIDWADIYDPIHGAATVDIVDGYSLIADYRSDSDRYESAGIVYGTGVNVITYTGLTEDLHRSFGFKVTAASDKILMWIVDGSTNIPFVDITAAGNIRVNNYTPSQTADQRFENQVTFLTRTAGSQIVTTAGGSVATFTIPNFPSGSTERSRTLQIGVTAYQGTTNTFASHSEDVSIPALNVAQSIQTFDASIQLGPLHGNQTVNVTIGYEYRVDGANLVVDLTLETAPSGIRVSFDQDTAALLSYTSQNVVARVDDFLNLADAAGDYTFTGEQEFIISMRPTIGTGGQQTGFLEVVPAAVGADGVIDQLNDTNIRIPTPVWESIEVADDIEFRTFEADHYFRHSEVAGLLQHRNEKWTYGLARLQTDNAGHSITEPVDLAAGSTIGGSPIGPGTVQAELVVHESLNKTTGQDGLVSSVVLPANYATYRYVHVTEYDASSLQFRHAEFPTYILSAGLVDTNDNVRLQGNTVLGWTAGTRTLAMNPVAQEILRVTLKD